MSPGTNIGGRAGARSHSMTGIERKLTTILAAGEAGLPEGA